MAARYRPVTRPTSHALRPRCLPGRRYTERRCARLPSVPALAAVGPDRLVLIRSWPRHLRFQAFQYRTQRDPNRPRPPALQPGGRAVEGISYGIKP
jgi:hypothetical protein